MGLYTLLTEYKGGGYISQTLANTPDEAALICVEGWDLLDFSGEIDDMMRTEILFSLKKNYQEGDFFTAVQGLHNIWYHDLMISDYTMHMNVVLTHSD